MSHKTCIILIQSHYQGIIEPLLNWNYSWWIYINPCPSVSKHHALRGQHELLHNRGADLWTLWQVWGGEEGGDGLGQVQENSLRFLLPRVRSLINVSLHWILLYWKYIRFYLREDAEAAVRFINGTRLDDRIIRWGIKLIILWDGVVVQSDTVSIR